MHTLQRDMTVPPFSFSIQVAQHYIQPRRRLCLFFGKSTLPFFFCFFFFGPFSHLFLFLHLITNISSFFYFIFFIFAGSWYYSQRMKRFLWFILPYPARQCCPSSSSCDVRRLFYMGCQFWWIRLGSCPTHTHTQRNNIAKNPLTAQQPWRFFFLREKGGGVIYVDLIWIIYTERVSGAHIISICVLALLRYP